MGSPTAISAVGNTTALWQASTKRPATRFFTTTPRRLSCASSGTAPGCATAAACLRHSICSLLRVARTRSLTHGLRRWAAAPALQKSWPGIPAGITATKTLTKRQFWRTCRGAGHCSNPATSFKSTMAGKQRSAIGSKPTPLNSPMGCARWPTLRTRAAF